MPQCILHSCVAKHQGLLHKFPTNKTMRRIWFESIMKRRRVTFAGTPYLCENHFRKDDYQYIPGCDAVLKSNAVPTIFRRTYCAKMKIGPSPYDVDSFEHFTEYFAKHLTANTLAMYNVKVTEEFVSFYKLTFTDGVASVKVNIAISDQLDVTVYIHDEMVYPSNLYWVIPKTGKLTKFMQLDILLRYYREGNQVIVQGQNKYHQNLEMANYFINCLILECNSHESRDARRASELLSLLQGQVSVLMSEERSEEAIEFAEELLGISSQAYDITKSMLDLPEPDAQMVESDDDTDIIFIQ